MQFSMPEIVFAIITWVVLLWTIIWAWNFKKYVIKQARRFHPEWENDDESPSPPPGWPG